MDKRHPVLERLARGQGIVLDGGVRNELRSRGYRPDGPLGDAAAAREVPELLGAVHRAFVEAGADVLTAYTSRTSVRSLSRAGLGMRASSVTHQAVDLALEAAAKATRPVAVAGTLSSLEDAAQPERTPAPRALADEHGDQARRLAATGCTVILVEGMATLRESLAATAAARAVMSNVWSVISVRDRARMHDGSALDLAATLLVSVGAQALLLDGATRDELLAAVGSVGALALGVPIGVRFNPAAGDSPERFASDVAPSLQRGVRLVGGGELATPDHIRALAARMRARAAA